MNLSQASAPQRSLWRRALLVAGSLVLACSAQATVIFTGTLNIAPTDPVQLGRLSRNNVPQDWSGSEAFPGFINTTTSYRYTTLTLNLSALQSGFVSYGQFLQINFDSPSPNTFLAAYLNTYSPTGASTTWLGDPGNSGNPFGNPSFFQVIVPAGSQLVLVLNETTTNAGINFPGTVLVEAFTDTLYTNLVPVPEPAGWALMLAGLLALPAVRAAKNRSAQRTAA